MEEDWDGGDLEVFDWVEIGSKTVSRDLDVQLLARDCLLVTIGTERGGEPMRSMALILFFTWIPVGLTGCESAFFQAIFQEQEWSENYTLADGVRCTAPEMIDGDVNTAGKTVFPEGVYGRTVYGAFPSAETEIVLPEKKSIRKIVIRSEDLSTFDVLASIGGKDDWKLIKEFDKNTEKEIIIRTSVVTDKIKIRARGKESFEGTERAVVHGGMTVLRSAKITEPEIQEIELYGFK
jgi:hypothetical protein